MGHSQHSQHRPSMVQLAQSITTRTTTSSGLRTPMALPHLATPLRLISTGRTASVLLVSHRVASPRLALTNVRTSLDNSVILVTSRVRKTPSKEGVFALPSFQPSCARIMNGNAKTAGAEHPLWWVARRARVHLACASAQAKDSWVCMWWHNISREGRMRRYAFTKQFS